MAFAYASCSMPWNLSPRPLHLPATLSVASAQLDPPALPSAWSEPDVLELLYEIDSAAAALLKQLKESSDNCILTKTCHLFPVRIPYMVLK